MPVNQGGSTLKGIYLGDQLLTGGGGNAQELLESAISTPDASSLVTFITSPDRILTDSRAVRSISNDKPSFDALVANKYFNLIFQYYPTAQIILNSSPFVEEYIPGPTVLTKGTKYEGYYGSAQSSEFGIFLNGTQKGKSINATTLAAQVGITTGTMMNNTIRWHKFATEERILYIAEKAIRYGISWNDIDNRGCVTGTTVINMQKGNYKVRLLSSGEWSTLLVKLNNGTFASLPDTQLDFRDSGNGHRQWTSTPVGGSKLVRYGPGGAMSTLSNPTLSTTDYGWRPALELKL